MTTGERIAQKRRETGLSQEQLGTELGVSRQTIYKSDSMDGSKDDCTGEEISFSKAYHKGKALLLS